MDKIKNNKVTLGIVLILIGIIWILSNLNLIDINLYSMLRHIIRGVFDLWPLILIIIGIDIIFKKEGLNTILWILFLIVVIVYSLFMKEDIFKTPSDGIPQEGVYTPNVLDEIDMREDIDKGNLNIDIGATSFTLSSIEDSLLSLDHDGAFIYKFDSKGSTENVYVSNKDNKFKNGDKRSFQLGLNKTIPWNLDMDMGAVSGKLDLEDIEVENIDLDMGAGSVEITLGDKAKKTSIDIDAGASQIVLNIPKDSGVKINLEGALNSTNLEEIGLIKTDRGNFVSGNFNSASSNYQIEVDMGVGQFRVNYY